MRPHADTGVIMLVLTQAIFFLALVNPVSKVVVLAAVAKEFEARELASVALRATAVALIILLGFGLGGSWVLTEMFHAQVYSLRVAGGVLLFIIGMQALMKGRFFEVEPGQQLSDITIVPLASPMIAGPATITAAISQTAQIGFPETAAAIVIALLVNFAFMLLSLRIGLALNRMHVMGALIRITGLFVASIAVEMILGGVREWYQALQTAHPV